MLEFIRIGILISLVETVVAKVLSATPKAACHTSNTVRTRRRIKRAN